MRYYSIEFSNPKGGYPQGVPAVYTSHPNGIYNPGCPEIEFDIANVFADATIVPTHLRIHNVPVSLVENARQYNGMSVQIKGGFKTAIPSLNTKLPLENPSQAGLIGQGVVQTCYGNWLGTDLVLDFMIWPNPNLGSANTIRSFNTGTGSPRQLQFLWEKGGLAQAILTTLKPLGITKVQGTINSALNNPRPTAIYTYFTSIENFANYIQSKSVIWVDAPAQDKNGSGTYQSYIGVRMAISGDTVIIYDGTPASVKTIQLQYGEFIGQPTWVSADGILQSVHPMRNDILLGNEIKYPTAIPTIIGPQNSPALRQYNINESIAPLKVLQVRHIGKYRSTSATAWCTQVNAGSAIRINPNNPQAGVQYGQVRTYGYDYTPTS